MSVVTNPRKMARLALLIKSQEGLCPICGNKLRIARANFDHIKPKCDGGSGALHNLRAVHKGCNLKRGNKPASIAYRIKGLAVPKMPDFTASVTEELL